MLYNHDVDVWSRKSKITSTWALIWMWFSWWPFKVADGLTCLDLCRTLISSGHSWWLYAGQVIPFSNCSTYSTGVRMVLFFSMECYLGVLVCWDWLESFILVLTYTTVISFGLLLEIPSSSQAVSSGIHIHKWC